MSWLDAAKIDESPEDRSLRAELQDLLGFRPVQTPPGEATPETIALAQSLNREATRRRRTANLAKPSAKRPFLLLAAAVIPVLFTITALGTWGVKQKRRADAMAAKAQELETKQNRIDAAKEGARNREAPLLQAAEPNNAAPPNSRPDNNSNNQNGTGELIKPEERPRRLDNQADQYRVNDRR